MRTWIHVETITSSVWARLMQMALTKHEEGDVFGLGTTLKESKLIAALMLLWLSIQWPLRCRTLPCYQKEAKMWPLPSGNRRGRVPFHNRLLVAVRQRDSGMKEIQCQYPRETFLFFKVFYFYYGLIDWIFFWILLFWISKEFHHPKQRILNSPKIFPRRDFPGEDFLRRFCLKHSFLSWAQPCHPRTSELAFCFLPFHVCWPQQEIDTDHCCLRGCCHWPDSAGTPLSCGFRPAFPLETMVTFLCTFSPRMQGLSSCWLTHKTEGLFFLPNWKPPGRKQNFDPSIQWI